MSAETPVQNLVILFADVAGSTQLYSSIGDIPAEKQISQCLAFMVSTIKRFKGVLVKSIGDEVLCYFESVANALQACCEIQSKLSESSIKEISNLNVRMGLHAGPVLIKDNDVFGDTVNVAARMVSLAQAKQIICTTEIKQQMPRQLDITIRPLQPCYIKGKAEAVNVFEVIWNQDTSELTSFFVPKTAPAQNTCALELKFNGQRILINSAKPEISIGRGTQCDLVVNSPQASRLHAQLSYRRDKIVLIDQSTNGTFIQNNSPDEIFVNKEEVPLIESGRISLGISIEENPDLLVYFKYL